MNEKRNLLLEFKRVVFEVVFFVEILSLHFLDVVKFLLVEREYFRAVIEEHSEWIVAQNVADAVLGAVIDPFLHWNIIIPSLLHFLITLGLQHSEWILVWLVFYWSIFESIPVRTGLQQSPIELVGEVGSFLDRASFGILFKDPMALDSTQIRFGVAPFVGTASLSAQKPVMTLLKCVLAGHLNIK